MKFLIFLLKDEKNMQVIEPFPSKFIKKVYINVLVV